MMENIKTLNDVPPELLRLVLEKLQEDYDAQQAASVDRAMFGVRTDEVWREIDWQLNRDIMVRVAFVDPAAQALFREPVAKAVIPSSLSPLGAVARLFAALGVIPHSDRSCRPPRSALRR